MDPPLVSYNQSVCCYFNKHCGVLSLESHFFLKREQRIVNRSMQIRRSVILSIGCQARRSTKVYRQIRIRNLFVNFCDVINMS